MMKRVGIWPKVLIVTTIAASAFAVSAEEVNAIGRGLQEGLFTEADIKAYLDYQTFELAVRLATAATIFVLLWFSALKWKRSLDMDEPLSDRLFCFLLLLLPVLFFFVACFFGQWAYLGDKADVLTEAFETAEVEAKIEKTIRK